jgi:hypothetical protein
LLSFSSKNLAGILLSLAFFCQSANILAMIFSKPNFPCCFGGAYASACVRVAHGDPFPGDYVCGQWDAS